MGRVLAWNVIRLAGWLGAGVFALTIAAYVRPTLIGVLLALFGNITLLIGALVAVGYGVIEWRKMTNLWIVPALTYAVFAAASLRLSAPIGRLIGDLEFRRHLNEYQQVVETLGAEKIPGDCEPHVLIAESQWKLPPRISHIRVTRCDQGMTVELLVGADVPTLHEGYVFRGYGIGDSPINDGLRIPAKPITIPG